MADVITRFKLETTQFDSKLRDSAKSLSNLARHFSLAGKDFDKFAAGSVESARSLGNVATSANNVKDRLKELVGAYNETAKAYNILTKEQQEGDFGKAMAESLQTLKGRITETKQELYGLGDQGKSTGGLMDSLKDKITLNVDAIKLFSLGMSGAKAALNVAKDAFFESETNVDAWGMTVQSATTIYDTFIQSLNSGNFSNFFTNLDNIISKAQDAYNALDNLGTVMTIINPERAKLQARQTELKATIRREGATSEAGKAAQQELRDLEPKLSKAFKKESKMNYDAFSAEVDRMLATAGITLDKKSKSTLMRSFSDSDLFETLKRNASGSKEWTTSGTLENQRVSWTDNRNTNQKLLDLFTDDWRKQWSPFLTASYSARGSAASSMLGDARYLRESGKTPGGGGGGSGKPTTKAEQTELQQNQKLIADLTAEYQSLADKVNTATGQELVAADDRMTAIKEEIQYLRQRNDALNKWADIALGNANPARVEAGDPRKAGFKLIGGETGIGSMNTQATVEAIRDSAKKAIESVDLADPMLAKFQSVFVDSNALANVMKVALENGLNVDALDFSILRDKIGMGIDIPDETWSELEGKINEMLAGLNIEPIKLNLETGAVQGGKNPVNTAKETADAWDKASQAIQSVGSAMQSIEDPAAKVAGLVAQAIATVASAYAQALATDWTSKSNIWAFIAAAAASTASMISTITAIHKATGYAEGGIIKGNSYSGDNIGGLVDGSQLVGLNAGEIVLNAAQQNSVAGLLQGQAGAPTSTRATISGEQLVIAINNFGRRRGRGELIPL